MKNFFVIYTIVLIILFVFWNAPQEKTKQEQCEESVHALPANLYGLPTSAKGVFLFCKKEENQKWIEKIKKR